MKNKPFTYVSLFSSAGIGCYGFKMENFECVATNELIERRLNVQKVNHKCKYESGYIYGDITLDKTKEALFNEIKMWNKTIMAQMSDNAENWYIRNIIPASR